MARFGFSLFLLIFVDFPLTSFRPPFEVVVEYINASKITVTIKVIFKQYLGIPIIFRRKNKFCTPKSGKIHSKPTKLFHGFRIVPYLHVPYLTKSREITVVYCLQWNVIDFR